MKAEIQGAAGERPPIKALEEFLARDPSLAARLADEEGNGNLHRAAKAGRADLCERLLEAGADPNAQNEIGWTPMHEAAWARRADLCALLVSRGADPGIRDLAGRPPVAYLHLRRIAPKPSPAGR